MVTTVALLALGVFSIVNLVKSLIPVKTLPPAKLIFTLALSGLAAVAYGADVREVGLLTAGIFGASTLFHGLHKLLQAAGDDRRVAMIQRGVRR